MAGLVIPAAGATQGPSLIVRLYDTIKAVGVHKDRLYNLALHCDELLSTVKEYSPQFVGTDAGAEADEIERAIEEILQRVMGWARLGERAAFVRQNEIQLGIEECHRKITASTNRFMVALSMAMGSESQERERARQRDHLQVFDMIVKLLHEVRDRPQTIPLEASQPREQLLPSQVVTVDGQPGQGLGGGPQVAPSLRSRADYSGKIASVSEATVIQGSQLIFHMGEWTADGEHTALGRLRDQSPDSQKRFKEWIEVSLGLQHRNILNFVGHVTINDVVYAVNPNPWPENGNIREYLRRNPAGDRVRLLSEVASGVEFLHENGIVHGDLCDKNILINRDGKAIVCGFDLSKFWNLAISHVRWLAPERNTSTSVTSPTEKADIWSFGLLCLEVFTGKDPYHAHSDLYVPVLLNNGTRPEHPGSTAVGLTPKMWDLMQSCWQIDPAQRPSMSEIQSTIRDMLPRRDSRQPSIGNIDVPVPTLFAPATDTSSPSEASRLTDGMPSLLSPLGLTEVSPITQEFNTVTSRVFVGTANRQTNTQTRIRRASSSPSSRSQRLPPLPETEDTLDPNMQVPLISAPPQSTTREERRPARASTALSPSASSLPTSDLRRQFSGDSSSSNSTSSSNGSSRWRLFGHKRTQTTSNSSPRMIGDSLLPATPGRSDPSLYTGAPPARPPSPTRTWTTPTKNGSKIVPSRSATLSINLPQSRNWERVSPVVLSSIETAASDSKCLLLPAIDGTVSAGNLEGLVSRIITDMADPSRNDRFRTTFLTIYQLFASSNRLFDSLKRRFESPELDPVTARSRYFILLFIESWLKKGFADEDLKCTSMIKELILPLVDSEMISETMQAKAKEIASLIEDEDSVRLRQPKNCTALRRERAERPQGVAPADLAAALTVVEGDRFKCITYWDYVSFTRRGLNVRRIEVFNVVHDLVKVWVQTTVLESDFLEERMNAYEEWIHTAKECRALNNFSSTSAIVLALMSPLVTALALTCESKAKPALYQLAKELTPTDGVYQNTLQTVATEDLVPWLDLHLSILNSSFAQSNPIVEVDGHPLIDFKYCSKIAEQIESLAQYSPPPTRDITRPDVLAYVEYSLKSNHGDDVLRGAKERSALLADEERVFHAQREKMRGLGFAWSPPRRK